ncbi:hypothetical protein KY290_013017 [Solanum tuberosum]|uniref:Uncharacterized protein n=1 Tax=Solanum tuberosum TaxID=4113 RepID=A0ABQ7VLY0_SOLTU|nr:hypothetical protein KY285_012782 [Solanum tuberosum]KAH0769036.1 hypothetical protein KY290_013017 [Solanum tuberosum]
MDCFDDRTVVVGLDMLVVVELDMLVVYGRHDMKIVMDQVGKIMDLDSMDVRDIEGIVNGEHNVDVVKVVDGDMKYLPKPLPQ